MATTDETLGPDGIPENESESPFIGPMPRDLYDDYATRRDQETLDQMQAEIAAFDLERLQPESSGEVQAPPASGPPSLGDRLSQASEFASQSSLPAQAGGAVIEGLISGLPQVAGGALEGMRNSFEGLADLMEFTREGSEEARQGLAAAGIGEAEASLPEQGVQLIQRGIEGGLRELAFLTPQIEQEPGVVPGVVRGLSKFLVAFLPGLSAARGAGLGPITSGAVAGGAADLLTTSQSDQNLSNLIETLDPALQDSALTVLSIDPGDSSGVARAKTALEGMITGGAIDTVINAKVLASSFVDTLRVVKGSGAELTDTVSEIAQRVRGLVSGGEGRAIDDTAEVVTLQSQIENSTISTVEEARAFISNKINASGLDEDDIARLTERSQAQDMDGQIRVDRLIDRMEAGRVAIEAAETEAAARFMGEGADQGLRTVPPGTTQGDRINPTPAADQESVFQPSRFQLNENIGLDSRQGAERIIDRLRLENGLGRTRESGGPGREDVEAVGRFIDMVGRRMFDDVSLSISSRMTEQGRFNFLNGVVTLRKEVVNDGDLPRAAIHELWHSLSRFLPADDAFRMVDQFDREREQYIASNPDDLSSFLNGSYTQENYRFSAVDEFFTETMTDHALSRLDTEDALAPPGTLKRVAQEFGQFFRDILASLQSRLGMDHTQRIFNDFLKQRNLAESRTGSLDATIDIRRLPDFNNDPGFSRPNDEPEISRVTTPEERARMASTARAAGSIGANPGPTTRTVIDQVEDKSLRVLDFGAGPEARQSDHLREAGFTDVTSTDLPETIARSDKVRGLEEGESFDVVMAPNVLNVQPSREALEATIDELFVRTAPGGRVVANYPVSPRRLDLKPADIKLILEDRFESVERVGGTSSAPVFSATKAADDPGLAQRILGNERGAVGRGDPLEEARAQVFERLSRLNIPDEQKAQIMQGVNGAEDLETILRVDDGLARAEAIEAQQAGAEAGGISGAAPPPDRLGQVDVIRREPTVREGAEGIPVEDLRGERRRHRVPIKNLPDTEIELQEFIRRNGGIRLEGEELRGELERLISPRFLGRNHRLQNNSSGISLQEMAERANEAGFTVTADKTSLLEALDMSRNRREVFSEQRSGIVDVLGNPSTRRVYEDLLNFIDDFQGQVQRARRSEDGPRRRQFVHEQAAQLVEDGLFTRDDVRAIIPGTTLNDEETSALVKIMTDAGVEIQDLADSYINGGLVVGSQEARQFAFMMGLFADMAPKRRGVMAENARSVGILNDPLSSQNRFIAGFESIFENMPNETLAEVAKRVAALPRLDQVVRYSMSVGNAVRSGRLADPARAPSILLEYWVNALLSGPQTHAVNFLSNSLMVPGAVIERGLASFAGLVPGLGGDVPLREPWYMAWGAIQGAGDAFRYIGEGLAERGRTARSEGIRSLTRERRSRFERFVETDLGEAGAELVGEEKFIVNQGRRALTGEVVAGKLQSIPGLKSAGERLAKNIATGESTLGQAIDIMGELMRTPTRSLGASDDFFKAINYRMELQAQAVRQAHTVEGLRGKALTERIGTIINNPDDEISHAVREQAENFAAVQTFTNALGPGGQAAQLLVGRVPIFRAVVPFMKTPINLFSQAVRRTPVLNLASSAYRADLAAGGARRATAVAQMAMGSTTFMAAYGLVMAGKVTGGGPRHFGLQQQMRSEGWQPYSVRLGGQWVQYNRLDPVFMPFAIMADFTELVANADPDERTLGEVGTAALLALKDNMLSKTYIRGISDVVRAVNPTSPSAEASLGAIQRYGTNLVASLIPNVLRQAEARVDPKIRETYGLIDTWRARIPGLSETLPARRNLWGEEIYVHGGLGPDFISPLYTTSGEVSVATEVLATNDYPARLPPKKVGFRGLDKRIELTAEQHEAFMMWSAGLETDGSIIEGKSLQDAIADLADNETFNAAPLEDRQSEISGIISDYRNRAKDFLRTEFPEIQDAIDEGIAEQRDGGIGGPNELLRKQLRIESSGAGIGVTVR